jgi:diacylglycerol O-acyltransferase/trehalose O-mycolyltransferase
VTRPAALLAALCLLASACTSGGDRTGAAPPPPTATIVAEQQVAPRTHDLLVDSPAAGSKVWVRLLLPSRFTAEPSRRWPVLYLLHGCCDTYESWTRSTDLEALTAPTDLLVVMPDGGSAGFYSDWYNGGRGGPPAWETFHLTELRELLEARYRAGDRRAIAGLSMGGLGALAYAARHPGMFRFAASFSGVVHTRLAGPPSGQAVVNRTMEAMGEEATRLWGDPRAQARVWAEHNPYDLAGRLRGVELLISAGDGRPGPLDDPGATPELARTIEADLYPQNVALRQRLRQLGVPATFDLYGAGTHSWPYWERELHRAMPELLATLA